MSEKDSPIKKNMKICLLGASFETGNMGVSALAESSIKVILNRWPDAEIILLGAGYTPHEDCFFISNKEICVRTLPIRFCKNVFLPYHFLWFAFYGLLVRVLPTLRLKNAIANRNPHFKILYETDLSVDTTGGDSFSDIYGFRRFFLGFLCKWLVIFLRKKLVMLPQTYGPFKGNIARAMARYILRRASAIYSRDRDSVEYVKDLLGSNKEDGKIQFALDVAFVLDARKPDNFDASPLSQISKDVTVVGLNVSGLLFSGGYTQNNMFGLQIDYRDLVYDIIELFMKYEKLALLLVPHVFSPHGTVESDPDACLEVYERSKEMCKDRIFIVRSEYDHNEIKYIIGMCNFFIGSRMHSCIAALSQCVPVVGLAYSKKFQGVFETVGLAYCVADARLLDKEEILSKISQLFAGRKEICERLKNTIPQVKEDVLSILD